MEPIIGLKKETTVTIKSNQYAELREITTEIQSFPRDYEGPFLHLCFKLSFFSSYLSTNGRDTDWWSDQYYIVSQGSQQQ